MWYDIVIMTEKEILNTEEVSQNVEGESNTKTYSQAQVDDITSKVKENAIKLFIKENFQVEDVESFKSEFINSKAKLTETETKLKETVKTFKEKEIKSIFVNELGGREDAFKTLISANPNLLEVEDVKGSLLNIKKDNTFLFVGDKTIINLNESKVKNFYKKDDGKEYFDGTKNIK